MIIESFATGPLMTNAYIVACREKRIAFIIDPAKDSAPLILKYLEEQELHPQTILLTHSHWDHTADVYPLKESLQIDVMIHQADAANLIQPGIDQLPLLFAIKGVKPDAYLEEGTPFSCGKLIFEIIHTPGHSPGGICLYNQQHQVLFSGDTLFKGSIGNTSLPTANAVDLGASLKKLEALPIETKFYPGHGPASTLLEETWLTNAVELFELK